MLKLLMISEKARRHLRATWPYWTPVAIAAVFVLAVFLSQTGRSEIPDHGDIWSDTQLALQGERLAKAGPATLHYSGVLDDGQIIGLPPLYYVNWPATGVLLALCSLMRTGSLMQGRLLMLLVAGLALIAFYCLMWRRLRVGPCAALIGALALACAAPFRILSDSLMFFNIDTLGRITAASCVLVAALTPSWRRTLIAATGLFVAVVFLLSVAGYETIPSIGLYTALIPLVAASQRPASSRIKVASQLGLTYVAAVGVGVCLRIGDAATALGSVASAKGVLLAAIRNRSAAAPVSFRVFLTEQLYRLWVYYEWQLIVLAAATLVCACCYARSRAGAPALLGAGRIILVIAFCDCAWIFLVRQHSYIHVHTIHQLGPAICLITGVAAASALRVAPRPIAAVMIAGAAIAGILAFLNLGVVSHQAYGNVVLRWDWSYRINFIQPFAAVIQPGSLVMSQLGQQPTLEYAFSKYGLIYLNRPLGAVEGGDRPLYIVTWRREDSKEFAECMQRFQLVMFNLELALFRAAPHPELNRALLQDSKMQGIYSWNEPMWAAPLHPASPGVAFADRMEIPLKAPSTNRFRLWVMMPDHELSATDGVSIEADELGESGRVIKTKSLNVTPSVFRAARRWVSYPLGEMEESSRILRVRVGCGKENNCAADLVYAVLSLDQT